MANPGELVVEQHCTQVTHSGSTTQVEGEEFLTRLQWNLQKGIYPPFLQGLPTKQTKQTKRKTAYAAAIQLPQEQVGESPGKRSEPSAAAKRHAPHVRSFAEVILMQLP